MYIVLALPSDRAPHEIQAASGLGHGAQRSLVEGYFFLGLVAATFFFAVGLAAGAAAVMG